MIKQHCARRFTAGLDRPFLGELKMHVIQTKSSLLRPYTIQTLISEPDPSDAALRPTFSLGKALIHAAQHGTTATVAIQEESAPAKPNPPRDYVQIAKALGETAAAAWGGTKVAKAAWDLSALPATTTVEDLAKTLVANNVSPAKAPDLAKDILNVLQDPISRAVLVGIAAGVVTTVVVRRTQLSLAKKSALVIGAVAIAIGLFFAARHYGIAA